MQLKGISIFSIEELRNQRPKVMAFTVSFQSILVEKTYYQHTALKGMGPHTYQTKREKHRDSKKASINL